MLQPAPDMLTLRLADCPLKHLLRLFGAEEPIRVHELGDTCHPSSGYVDAAIVAGVTTVGQLRAHAYDFGGLVYFDAEVAGLRLRYHAEHYALRGPAKPIWRLIRRLEELNARPDFRPPLRILARSAE